MHTPFSIREPTQFHLSFTILPKTIPLHMHILFLSKMHPTLKILIRMGSRASILTVTFLTAHISTSKTKIGLKSFTSNSEK